ncbi:Malonyl-[acyl-carrier protein] O-methyltransferase [Streptomyces sp. MBT84]|uniref:methyltransferase domain-containing protein n=1 Tax=Streptomyces sp. MBT84 TaxID=1488414 RepID=UPI001C6E1359|nr:methyltransferase domain-containing protein [Streptomyces sp. MBT84]MBW8706595.1 Malonyl-[acyl-carrier protein] O-methyltransferase [Streptomyces sp. MBT84]
MSIQDQNAGAVDDTHRSGGAGSSDNPFAQLNAESAELQETVISYLDAVAAHHEMQRVRAAAFEVFAPAEGERLLDAGCGVGEVARQLGERVGGRGSVAAIDLSEHVIAAARSRNDGRPVDYAVGDITALDFPDDHFDGVRCERVLQHVQDPDIALKELARVTRPGGRVCVIDTDWSSSVGDGFDHLEQVVADFFPVDTDLVAGRAIRSRMVKSGLRSTTILPVTLRFTSLADAGVIVPFFNSTFAQSRLSAELFDRFYDSVYRSVDRGDFLFAFTMWIGLGRVPLH